MPDTVPVSGRIALSRRPSRLQESTIPAAGIGVCLLLQLHLLFAQPINWDEFRFLADIHSYTRGQLSDVLLTFQVHLFGWLVGHGNEIDQIRIGRAVMFALEIATVILICSVAQRFFDRTAALFAALAYVSFSFVLQHGASFRFDPMVTFLVMLSTSLLLGRLRWAEMAGTGFALALATMISVKVVLAFPLLIAIGAYRLLTESERSETLARLACAAAASLFFLGLLYAWHVSTLAGATNSAAGAHLSASYTKTLREIPFLPQRYYFLRALVEDPLHWLILLFGISAAIGIYPSNRPRALLLPAFLLPLVSILFYRNAFPYYYANILAPAAILFASAAAREDLRKFVGIAAVALTGGAVVHHQLALSASAAEQRQTVEAVHAMFPEPVPYLDRCSMIASFPQAGLFMSSWWTENYAEAARPLMQDLLAIKRPVFVIADSPLFSNVLEGRGGPQLLDQDRVTLRSNYVHYWGPIWIAGKEMRVGPTEVATEFPVPGNYIFVGRAPIRFDGKAVVPGEVLPIGQGPHRVASTSGQEQIVLRWAAVGRAPSANAPTELKFGRF